MQKTLFKNKKDSRVLLVDWGYYMHTSIFAHRKAEFSTATDICLGMVFGDLKRLAITKEDIVIVAIDKGKSWRKKVDTQYKSTRKEKRDSYKDIDWDIRYKEFNKLLVDIDINTPFHVIGDWGLEADDVISYGVRKFKDKECIILSVDGDFDQLFVFDNVKIFSPHPKRKKYKLPPKNPYSIIASKIRKEASDDLISPITSEKEYDARYKIINLLSLPEEVESKVARGFTVMPKKTWNYEVFSSRGKWLAKNLYNIDPSKIVKFEDSLKLTK